MRGQDCEDLTCEANKRGICTAGNGDECEGSAIFDEDYEEEQP